MDVTRSPSTHASRSAAPSDLELLDAAPESIGIDLRAVRHYRRNRVRHEMAARHIDALIICDPVNIRYATGTRNMQVFTARNTPARYLLFTNDRSILYDFTGCDHLAHGFDTVDEIRPATTASFVAAGPDVAERERRWADAMVDDLREALGAGKHRVGIERMNAGSVLALSARGLDIVDAQWPIEIARSIKSDGEIACIRASLRMTEHGVAAVRAAIRPGITENQLWAVMHQTVIANNGDYCETRLLNSGPRTNPWFQETSSRVIEANELVAFDTDVVGCHGYYSDFSRTFHVGPDDPTPVQRDLYRTAHEQVRYNTDIIGPGVTFRDYSERAWEIPDRYRANRYYLSAHGCGMTGEYPYLYDRRDFGDAGYDGVIEPGMTLCVESFIGGDRGEGVKLEQQLLVTDDGTELLSDFPFESALLD